MATVTDPATALAGHVRVTEDYGDPRVVPRGAAALLRSRGVVPPPDWHLTLVQETELMVAIVDAGVPTMTVTIPIVEAILTRGSDTVYLEVARTDDPVAASWVEWLSVGRDWRSVPLGRGFAAGPTAVIDTGKTLLRATVDDGRPLSGRESEMQARAASLLDVFR
jgi:hypothetical protein